MESRGTLGGGILTRAASRYKNARYKILGRMDPLSGFSISSPLHTTKLSTVPILFRLVLLNFSYPFSPLEPLLKQTLFGQYLFYTSFQVSLSPHPSIPRNFSSVLFPHWFIFLNPFLSFLPLDHYPPFYPLSHFSPQPL